MCLTRASQKNIVQFKEEIGSDLLTCGRACTTLPLGPRKLELSRRGSIFQGHMIVRGKKCTLLHPIWDTMRMPYPHSQVPVEPIRCSTHQPLCTTKSVVTDQRQDHSTVLSRGSEGAHILCILGNTNAIRKKLEV